MIRSRREGRGGGASDRKEDEREQRSSGGKMSCRSVRSVENVQVGSRTTIEVHATSSSRTRREVGVVNKGFVGARGEDDSSKFRAGKGTFSHAMTNNIELKVLS